MNTFESNIENLSDVNLLLDLRLWDQCAQSALIYLNDCTLFLSQ